MPNFREFISEVKVGRAWSGNLKRIDDLLSWMYKKDILNKTEKKTKDSLFNKYYRYYNDGDKPKGHKYTDDDTIKLDLEEKIEDFIKKILSKYLPKINRREFRLDMFIDKMNNLISQAEENNFYGLITYWKKDVQDSEVLSKISELSDLYNKIMKNKDNTYTLSYMRGEEMEKGTWTEEDEKIYKELQKKSAEIAEKLKNLKSAAEKMKELKVLK